MASLLKQLSNTLAHAPGAVVDHADLPPFTEEKNVPSPSTDETFRGDSPHFKLYWLPEKIDPSRWNKSYPYQLIILREEGVSKDGAPAFSTQYVFTLPIPPQDLSVSMPFASEVMQTLGGQPIEQHSGAPFRMISLNGTTGVAPGRRSAERAGAAPSAGKELANAVLAGSVIPGVGQALQRVARAADAFIDGNPKRQPNIHDLNEVGPGLTSRKDEQRGIFFSETGYWQFHALQRFLELYAKMKTKGDSESRKLRLGFSMWKDQHTYLVTPMRFEMRRQADRTYEYLYNLQLKAWARIRLDGDVQPYSNHQPAVREPGVMNRLFNDLNNASLLLQSVRDVAKATVADFDRILSIVRLTMNVVKSTANLALTISDMPQSFVDSWNLMVQDTQGAWDQAKAAFNVAFGGVPKTVEQRGGKKNNDRFRPATQDSIYNGLTRSADGQGDPRTSIKEALQSPEVASKLRLSGLPLNATLRKIIQSEKDRAASTTRKDLENMRNDVLSIAADYADQIGLGNATYNRVYGRKTQAVVGRTPTRDETQALWAMQTVARSLDRLAASRAIQTDSRPSSLEYIASLATAAGVPFVQPVSKFLVPVPYSMTLEMIARNYLGDALRWHELAALNNLRAPYVDEEGFDVPLLTNAVGHTVTVGSAANIYLGQVVWIGSTTKIATKRKIQRIDQVAPNYVIVTVDGDDDLVGYIQANGAYLHTYLPGTINSQMLMFIPSQLAPQPNLEPKLPDGVKDDGYLDIGGVDWLLTPTGDLVIGPDGDFRFAFGLTNIIQTARIIIGTPKGSMILHSEFGLGIKPGTNTADVDTAEIFRSLQETFSSDPMFSGLTSAAIEKDGPKTTLSLAVNIRGSSSPVPIALDLNS